MSAQKQILASVKVGNSKLNFTDRYSDGETEILAQRMSLYGFKLIKGEKAEAGKDDGPGYVIFESDTSVLWREAGDFKKTYQKV